jgi:uncharacterized membrane protein YheB (UPF0754 family)
LVDRWRSDTMDAVLNVSFEGGEMGIEELSIPLFTGLIGYITNWTGVWMLFYPVEYKGFRVPGLEAIAPYLPRRLKLVPMGLTKGHVGWQGIIPSRAAKMGSIAVDRGLARLGKLSDFYTELEPDKIAEHLLATALPEIRSTVDGIMQREHPHLWRTVRGPLREAAYQRVEAELPNVVRALTDEIGQNIDQLADIKLMVIRKMEERPELCNRVFQDVGAKEFRMIINFGFIFGFVFGIPLMLLTMVAPQWWLVPMCGIGIGWVTNWLAIEAIFEPVVPKRILGITFHGLFLRRQQEVAETYSAIIADEVITIANLGDDLLNGPKSDRTHRKIQHMLSAAVDRAVGPARPLARVAVGPAGYAAIGRSLAAETTQLSLAPIQDPVFNKRQSANIAGFIACAMRNLAPDEFCDLIRAAIKEDEWLLFLHGGVLGLFAGLVHVALFNWLSILG